MRFGIFTNPQKDKKLEATGTVIAALEQAGCDVFYDEDTAKLLRISRFYDAKDCDVLFVLGGDGTILRAARKYVSFDIALVGINVGRLGFMSEIDAKDVRGFIEKVRRKQYFIEERMMLEASVSSAKRPLTALNDFLITQKNRSKMIRLDLYVNDTLAENYTGDGLILSTPTGSTAYSMSAGGPIVAPDLQCILITPLCPHSMYARSIVTRFTDTIRVVSADTDGETVISPDGQDGVVLHLRDEITVTTSDIKTKFLRVGDNNFYSHLKMKLTQWNRTER